MGFLNAYENILDNIAGERSRPCISHAVLLLSVLLKNRTN